MWILGIDATGPVASCALLEGGILRGESYLNTGYTHSETLLPLILEQLKQCHIGIEQLDGISVTRGPGSFTGLRIGLATAKGLAFWGDTPCYAVSTLEAMAVLCPPVEGILCPVMDARRKQVYNALFEWEGDHLRQLTGERALPIEQLGQELAELGRPFWLTGDGAPVSAVVLAGLPGLSFRLAPEHLRMQRALGAALLFRPEAATPGSELTPEYLRLPQAERERLERLKAERAFQERGGDDGDVLV